MIRQDWMMRMIREMAQVLARMVSLKERKEYDVALRELDQYLATLRGGPVLEPPDVQEWIEACLHGEGAVEERLERMADLWRERGDLLSLEHRTVAAHHSFGVALGLFLERVKRGMVTQKLLDRIGECLAQTDNGSLPGAVLSRLLDYYETRGWLSRAEDVLFEWVEGGDSSARQAGTAFYERLRGLDEKALQQGNLSREEAEEGLAEFCRRTQGTAG